jgi:hypothetical protein
LLTLKTDAFVVFVNGQNENAVNSLDRNKRLEQGSRELNVLASDAPGYDMTRGSPVIIEVCRRGDVELKDVAVHDRLLD